jgi:hypothetical protein
MANPELRIVINEAGAFLQLHNFHEQPILIDMLSEARLDKYRGYLAQSNPAMRYASNDEVMRAVTERWFTAIKHVCASLTLSPRLWLYNASSDSYERA